MAEPFCRLTVLAPRRRVDVALPSDVPVAELVPMVLELVGEPGPTTAPRPWLLSGVVGGPLPVAATLGELGVLDGELLRLGPAVPVPAPPVFDDPVDAVAAGAPSAAPRAYRFEAAVVLTAAVAAAVLLGASGPGSVPSTLLAAVGATLALTGATRIAHRDHALARSVALAGVALAAAAGWAAVPGGPGPVPLMVAAVAAGVAAAAAQLLLRVVAPSLVAAGVLAVVGAAAVIAVRLGVTPVAAATGAAALAVAAGPLLPRAAIRLAGLPRPLVPADETELVDDEPPLPPAELAERAELARGYLSGLAGAAAVIAAVGALVGAFADGWAGQTFAGVTAAVLLLRARGFADATPAHTALAAGVAAAIGLAAGAPPGSPLRLAACAALLAGAAAGVAALGTAARTELSPVLRRTVDLVEGLLAAAAVPLAFAAMGLFQMVRAW